MTEINSHLTLDALLELEDSTTMPPAPPPAHLGNCAECAAALAGLRARRLALRTLSMPPPAHGWDRIAVSLARRRERRAALPFRFALAAAATLLLCAAGFALLRKPAAPAALSAAAAAPGRTPQLEALIRESQGLEARINAREPAYLSAAQARLMLAAESELADIDMALFAAPRLRILPEEILWQRRVDVLTRLAESRDPQPRSVGL